MAFVRPSSLTIAMAVRQRERPAHFGGYCATKSSRGIEHLPLMVPQDPLRQAMGGFLMKGDHAPFPIESDAAVMVDTFDSLIGY